MPITIPEMQRVKKNFPIYKDMDDVALLNMAARKYPQAYKGLAMQWGEKIRTERTARAAAQAEPEEKIPTSPMARTARTFTRSAGLKQLDTGQYIYRNIDKLQPVKPGENPLAFYKRFKSELGMEKREQEIASLGTVAQFDDMMTLGITTGMTVHPKATVKMLAWFAGLEKVADITGINKAIQGVKNATVKDVLDIAKFGLEGMLAGGLTKLGMKKAKANIAKSKAHPKVKATAEKMIVDLEAAAKAGEKVPDSVKYNKAEFTLKQALAQAEAARKDVKPKPIKPKTVKLEVKTPSVSSEVEVTTKPLSKIISGYRSGTPEGQAKAGTFYTLGKQQYKKSTKQSLSFKNILIVSDKDVGPHTGLPAESLFHKWFPKASSKTSGIAMDRAVAAEAVRRGYDGIQYGINIKEGQIQDLRGLIKTKPPKVEVTTKPMGKKEAFVREKIMDKKLFDIKPRRSLTQAEIKNIEKQMPGFKFGSPTSKRRDLITIAEIKKIPIEQVIKENRTTLEGLVKTDKVTQKQIQHLLDELDVISMDIVQAKGMFKKIKAAETSAQRRKRIFEESKAHQEAKKKKTGIGKDFERRLKDVLGDVNDALGGTLGSTVQDPKIIARQKAAVKRLQGDAKKSGKELGKYLQENLNLDAAGAAAIVQASKQTTSIVQAAKGKLITPEELAKKPLDAASEIIQEKMRNATCEAHRKNIAKKHGIKYETPTSDPAVVKDKPAIDPLMEKDTLFNPKDKASRRFNDIINKRLDNQMNKALKLQEKLKSKGKESKFLNDWIDTTFGLQGMQEKTGAPVYSKSYLQGVEIANIHQRTTSKITDAFAKGLKEGSHSPEGDARILKWITKRKGVLTAEEMKAAHKIQKIVRDFKPMIKYLTMRDYIAGRTKIPAYNKKLVAQGRRVLKKQGVEALEVWVKDKPFGVIEGDTYLPSNILRGLKISKQKQGAYEIILPQTKQRIATEQYYDDSIPLLARMHQYVESTLRKYYFQDYLLETQKMIKPYKDSLSSHDITGFERWLSVLQGQGIPGVGPVGRIARKARGQFFKTVLFDPYKWGRNLMQNVSMLYQNYPLSTNIVKTAQMLKTKLSTVEREFFDTHVSQLGALRKEYLYLYEGKVSKSPYGRLDASAIKVAEAYTLTDTFNRLWAFKHALAGSLKDMALYKSGKINLNKFIKRQGLGSMTDLEIKHIMGLKPEQARLQIARFIVEKTHVRYKKHERGIAALSEAGEIGSSLLQFPRTVISRYLDGARMIIKGRTHHERWQGAQLIIGYGIMQWVANEILFSALGSKTYYDPDLKREVEARPYGLLSATTGLNFGGAQISQVKEFNRGMKLIANVISEEINGRFKGAKGHKRRMTMIREILKIGDRFGESFQPYWKKALDAIEIMTGHKSYKLLTTTFDHVTKRTSALKRNKIERDIMTRIMHFIAGTEAKERKAFDPNTLPVIGQHFKKEAKGESFYIHK